ncbi:MAG: type II secretion system protein [Syntrophobacterales bacterium]|jgi:prepilin-type N-terminal cleavage/methylation domain-containing protein
MKSRSKIVDDTGYTLIEIVMVIVILGVIGAFTFQFVAHGVQAFQKSSARKELYDQGRLALERMVRELRDAKQVIGSSTDSITFKKAHPNQAADYIEEIKFQLNGSNLERVGNPSGAPVTAVMASNVSGFSVSGVASGGGGGSVPCTIASDSQSSGFADSAMSLTFNHTIGGSSNRILVVGVSIETCNPYQTVNSVTYGGQTLTFLTSAEVTSSNACRGRVELYYLLEADMPGAGPFNVYITATGTCDALAAGAISLTGVAQQAPEASNTNANDAQSTISTSITTLTDGAWLVDVVHSGNPGTFTANSGQTVRYDQASSTSEVAGSTLLVASAGSTSLGWINTSANRLAQAVAAFAPATGCGSGVGGTNLVMVTGDGAYSSGVDDSAKKTLFESWGWTVTAIDDGTADYSTAAANNDVMFISESSSSGTVGSKARDLDIGVVMEEDYCWDEMEFGAVGDGGEWGDSITITNNSHYITSPFSTGSLTIYTTGDNVGSLPSSLASGGVLLANENAVGDPTLFVFDTGADLDIGTATNRRVGIPTKTSNPANWNNDLKTIIQRSLDWVEGGETGNVVTLELTLSSSEGGTVSMRTKVYLRNLP